MKFAYCNICKKLIEIMSQEEIPTICCGAEMIILEPKKEETGNEKHLPAFEIKEKEGIYETKIKVGTIEHPMEKEHLIEWIIVKTKNEIIKKKLHSEEKPEATIITKEKPEEIFSYCNIHGLWSVKV